MQIIKQRSTLITTLAVVALAGQADFAEAARRATVSGVPALDLSVDHATIETGNSVVLSWTSENVSRCQASGDWSGRQADIGAYVAGPLTGNASFTLTCRTAVGTIEQSVAVAVTAPVVTDPVVTDPVVTDPVVTDPVVTDPVVTDPVVTEPVVTEPVVQPTLALSASATSIRSGESVTLTWTGAGISNCQATGSWSGARDINGSELRSALVATASYTLTCDSANGAIIAMTSVEVTSAGTTVAWQAPTENVDGSAIEALASYRIYIGSASQTYDREVDVNDANLTQFFLDLVPGEYYISMTAIDANGNESALSNEVHRIVQ